MKITVFVAAVFLVAGGIHSQALGQSANGFAPSTQACAALSDNVTRLACFDAWPAAKTGAAASSPRKESPATPTKRSAAQKPAEAASPRHEIRFDIGYGVGIASHDGTFIVQHGTVRSESGFGNAGQSYYAQAWLTGWPGRNWQTGLEYFHLQNVGAFNINLVHGLSVLTDPLTGIQRQEVLADMGFLNLAYAPPLSSGLMRPYLGAGLGIGYGAAHYELRLHNDFIGNVVSVSSGASPFGGLQGYMGVDFRLSPHYFLGVQSKVLWVTAHPVGIDQRYLDLVLTASLGVSL